MTHDSNTPDTATGTVSFTDLDLSDTHAVTITGVVASGITTGLAPNATELGWLSLGPLTDSSGGVTGSKSWTFSAPDHYFDYLAAGEQVTLTYTVQVDDHHGGVVTQPVTITVSGTNDAPVITSGTQSATLREVAGTHDSNMPDTATGTVTFTDLDLSDTHAVTITGVVASGTVSGIAANATELGWLSLGPLTDSSGGVTGSKAWTFSAPDHYFDYLAVGEQVTLAYTVQVDDRNGGVVTQPVTITVTGTNDAPVITSGTQAATLTEMPGTHDSNTPDTATGAVTFTDLDLSDTHTETITGVVASGITTGLAPNATELGWLSLGALTDSTGGGTGSKSWTFSAPDHYFDYLADGEHLTLTYTVEVSDHNGGVVDQLVTITVNGSNDAPVANPDSDIGHIVEAGNDANDNIIPGTPTTTGNVLSNDTDLDLSDTHNVVGVVKGTATGVLAGGVGTSVTGLYGSLQLNADGTWTYTLDNSNPATNALAQGVHVNDIFSYTESDHHGGTATTTLSIDIAGTNDAPVTNDAPFAVTDTNTGSPVVEKGVNPGNTPFDGTATATGNVLANDFDIDTGDTKTVQGVASGTVAGVLTGHVGTVVTGTYGSVTIGSDGTWTYTLDNNSVATQALNKGVHVSDVFTYTMHDAEGATASAPLTIDITGTNDAPTLAPVTKGALVDTAANDSFGTISGTLVGNDLDSGETAMLSYATLDNSSQPVNTAVAGLYGSLVVNHQGGYTYFPDANAINALHAGSYHDTFTVQTTDVNGASGTAVFTVDVTGANDAPTLQDANAGTLIDTAASDSFDNLAGTLVGNDLDSGETTTLRYAALDSTDHAVNSGVTGLYGSLTVNTDGTYTYVPDANAINALHAGAYHDTFTVQTKDVNGAIGTATLTVDVTGTDDAPLTTDEAFSIAGNGGTASGNLLANATDAEHDTLSISFVAHDAPTVSHFIVEGTYGEFVVARATGSYTYTLGATPGEAAAVAALAPGAVGLDDFTYTVFDGNIGTDGHIAVSVVGINDAPVFTGEAAGTTYNANAAAVAIATNVAASDVDSANYSGGTLTATVINGGHEGDTLSIANGHGISFDGTDVWFDADGIDGPGVAMDIGTLTNNGINSLTFTLNSHATDAAVDALAQAVQFQNSTSSPIEGLRTVAFTLHDGGGTLNGGHDSAYFTADVDVAAAASNHAPVISTDQFVVTDNHGNGTTTVSGLYVSDPDSSDTFTMTATTGLGSDSSVSPSSEGPNATLADINTTLANGVTYSPGPEAPQNDSVTFTVTDSSGASDTVNFIFNQGNSDSPVTLTGTAGKDVIFATGNNDTLTGGAGADQFVFKPSDNVNSDAITDFAPGQDHIDLRAFSGTIDSASLATWLADTHNVSQSTTNPADVLITLDANDTITLKNVALANLHVGDFHRVAAQHRLTSRFANWF